MCNSKYLFQDYSKLGNDKSKYKAMKMKQKNCVMMRFIYKKSIIVPEFLYIKYISTDQCCAQFL